MDAALITIYESDRMWLFLIAIVIGVIFVMRLQAPAARRGRRSSRQLLNMSVLEREYARLLQMPLKPAKETLDRVLIQMQRDFPDRSREWHLQKLIADLRRDKR